MSELLLFSSGERSGRQSRAEGGFIAVELTPAGTCPAAQGGIGLFALAGFGRQPGVITAAGHVKGGAQIG